MPKILLKKIKADVCCSCIPSQHKGTLKIIFLPLFCFRGLKFLKGFLTEVKNGEKDIQTALSECSSYFDFSVEEDVERSPLGEETRVWGELLLFKI